MNENKENNFTATRYFVSNQLKINATPDDVFSLACPVEELKWIRNWKFDMIYSESGVNENNCIFRESMSGMFVLDTPDIDTFWHTTLYDKESHRFHALLMFGNLAAGKFEFTITENKNGSSIASWQLTYTALNEEGNEIADDSLKERMVGMLNFLGESAKHYLETGEML
jgi:hypothetical protein